VNTQAIIDQPYQFDFYDGGGLDLAFLGLAQADREGNLNVSKFGRVCGAGGFINISQSAKSVVFVGTFTAGDLQVVVEDGRLQLLNDIGPKKFVQSVEHRTFAAARPTGGASRCSTSRSAACSGWRPTARTRRGRAGIDIEREILARMDFEPIIRGRRD